MICDFCVQPDPTWTHFTKKFVTDKVAHLGEKTYDDDGMWAACDSCHDLILAEDRRTLLRRSVNMDPNPEANGATTRINQLHTLFWQNYLYRFEAMNEEELTAEHRLVAFRQGPHAPYQAVCRCGWEAEPSPFHGEAKRRWMDHSGGKDWAVQYPKIT
jgi:hypothetical protein